MGDGVTSMLAAPSRKVGRSKTSRYGWGAVWPTTSCGCRKTRTPLPLRFARVFAWLSLALLVLAFFSSPRFTERFLGMLISLFTWLEKRALLRARWRLFISNISAPGWIGSTCPVPGHQR